MYIKKDRELELILEGGKLMGKILEDLSNMVVVGMSAWDVDQKAEKMIIAAGGIPAFKGYKSRPSDPPFPSTICASINDELVHGIATKEKVIGFVTVADEIKTESKQAVINLHKLGIKVIMLTGDDEKTAKYMASLVGIDDVIAHLLPQDKMEKIKEISLICA